MPVLKAVSSIILHIIVKAVHQAGGVIPLKPEILVEHMRTEM